MSNTFSENKKPEGDRNVMSGDSEFHFLCHPDVPCFTVCCHDVTIFLTPHDVLRMKNNLKLKSWEFLSCYTKVFYKEHNPFPYVQLAMKADETKPCPFVDVKGCSIYDDRPWSCRMYPLDLIDHDSYATIVDSDKCKGLLDKREWIVSEWLQNQGVPTFDEYDHLYSQLTGTVLGMKEPIDNPQVREMIYMAAYDLDRFRKFVFESRFLTMFDLPDEEIDLIRSDDHELLKLGFKWLGMGLINPLSMKLKSDVIDQVLEQQNKDPNNKSR